MRKQYGLIISFTVGIILLAACSSATPSNLLTATPTITSTNEPTATFTATSIPNVTPTEPPKIVPVSSDYAVGAYYWISWNTQEVLTHFMDWNDSMFQPFLGKYDSTDTSVIDTHIKWAVEHGISFFAVQFYETQLKAGFMKASYLQYIKFSFIAPVELSIFAEPDLIVQQIKWMSPYFRNPQYLRIEQRPVVFFLITYTQDSITLQEETELLTRIQEMKSFAQESGVNPYLVGVYVNGDGRYITTRQSINQEFDAITVYNMAGTVGITYDDMVSEYILRTKDWSEGSKAINVTFIPNLIPGWDDSLSYQHGTRPWIQTRPGNTPEKFQIMCDGIKEYIDPEIKVLMVTAWNEFAEGSVIEPTEEFGFGYLNVIMQTFGTQK